MTKLRQQPAHHPCRAVWHNVLGDGSSPLSPTTHSCATGDFPETDKGPAIGGLLRLRFGLRETVSGLKAILGVLSLGRGIPFPGNGDRARQRLGSNVAVTPKEVRASGAGETIQRAGRRGEPLPFHEGAGPR